MSTVIIDDLERTLEVLRDPKQHFQFNQWTYCACGHLYKSTHNGRSAPFGLGETHPAMHDVIQPRGRYQDALLAILAAHDVDHEDLNPAFIVSDMISMHAAGAGGYRASSIVIIETTIKYLRDQLEAREQVMANLAEVGLTLVEVERELVTA